MLLGFKKRFIEPIQIGTKVFTMRFPRKNMPKVGEVLYMYSGLRTANCIKISDKEKLISTQKVKILINYYPTLLPNITTLHVSVDSRSLTENEKVEFVKFDGFTDEKDFIEWWITGTRKEFKIKKSQPIRMEAEPVLYHWTDLRY